MPDRHTADAADDTLRERLARIACEALDWQWLPERTETGHTLVPSPTEAIMPAIDALLPRIREHVASVKRHDPRCLSLTDSENNVYCDCRTLAMIDGAKAATERAEKSEAAIERVRAIADNWSGGPCISGYRIPNVDDSDSECLHCAADVIVYALDGSKTP